MTAATPFPRTLDDITPTFVSEALGADVASIDVTQIAIGEGFMGKLARVAVTYGSGASGPATVVAKVPTDDEASIPLGQMLGLWEREARFYRDVAPGLSQRVPVCHYVGGDEATGLFSLLIEDLSFATVGDQVAGASAADAERAVDWLAAFHSTWWGAAEAAFPWMPRTSDHPNYQALQPMLEAVYPTFLSHVGDALPASAVDAVAATIPRLTADLAVEHTPSTVIHADYRLDNLFFTDNGVIPVDWQSMVIGQPLYDLSYFIGTGLPVDTRRALERDLVARWRAGVVEHAGPTANDGLPDGDELFDRYRETLLMTMRIGALLFGQIDFTVNERAAALARNSAARLFQAGADLEVGEFVDQPA